MKPCYLISPDVTDHKPHFTIAPCKHVFTLDSSYTAHCVDVKCTI